MTEKEFIIVSFGGVISIIENDRWVRIYANCKNEILELIDSCLEIGQTIALNSKVRSGIKRRIKGGYNVGSHWIPVQQFYFCE